MNMHTTVCKHLRTKKMFIPAQAAEAFSQASEIEGSSCHCWCNRTLTEVGADDQPVNPEICRIGRSCFDD
jgi:hypothetical protein